jgi:predicted outer membrane protein
MIRSLLAVGVIAVSVAALAGACKGDEQPAATPDTPAARAMDSTEVLAFLAAVNQSEVQAGQVGTRRASDAEVRRFAQLLWREHAQSGRDVAELARQMEIDLRAATPPARMKANLDALSQQTSQLLDRTPKGPGFDRAFLDSQIRAHQALVQDLRRIVSDSGRVAASLAPGGGVDVGVTGRPDTSAAAAASRAVNRKAENALDAAQIMLAQVQQHLERGRQLQARLGSTSSPAPRSSAPAARPRS